VIDIIQILLSYLCSSTCSWFKIVKCTSKFMYVFYVQLAMFQFLLLILIHIMYTCFSH